MSSGSEAAPRVFRLPRSAYLVVLFIAFGTIPLAFTSIAFDHDSHGTLTGPPATIGWQTVLIAVPVLAALFIRRTATLVDAAGIRVRALFGTQSLRWDEIRGLSVQGRTVYAVTGDGLLRLPCVHVADLGALSRASGGRVPELPDPRPKFAPQRRRRR